MERSRETDANAPIATGDGKGEPRRPDAESSNALVPLSEQPPAVLPTIILDDLVPFPGPVVPVLVEDAARRDAVLNARSQAGFLLLVNRLPAKKPGPGPGPEPQSEPGPQDAGDKPAVAVEAEMTLTALGRVGVVGRLLKVFHLPEDRMSALVQLMRRASPVEILKQEPFPIVRVEYPAEVIPTGTQFDALFEQVRLTLQGFFEAHPSVPDELKVAAMSVEAPGILADFVGQHLARNTEERLALLTELDVGLRLHRALEIVVRELDLLTVGNRITQEIRQKVEKGQRDYLLREQLKAIRTELGEESDPVSAAVKELQKKLKAAGLSETAQKRADEELERLKMVPPESPEHNVVRSYLEWIASLPWSRLTPDNTDIVRARAILDEDHYGLGEVKDRIIEFLAARQLNPDAKGSMLCFAGPPGVGKTSLGQSIARALGRTFYRFSVGGMRDEAEIKGHRRTYIGAMPGRILQGLRQVQAKNPVFMLDEIDKMGSDWRGDPSSAMLEVLDPAQNGGFLDHYLDLPFDLSRVMFIATANVKAEIPPALLDRMEVIDLPGYIPDEKIEIAVRHLLSRQRKESGVTARQLTIGRPALAAIIIQYTHEAGVRELERQIGKICRKRATQIVRGKTKDVTVRAQDVAAWLGPPKVPVDRLHAKLGPGVAVGLAWTPMGGDVLFIEATSMPGKGNVKVTGQLGEVMSESAALAISYVRSRAKDFGIDPEDFNRLDLHLHFPAGAVKKDGPSAGVTVTSALISLLTSTPLLARLAMTGEMTLRGEVLPVGGIREKVVAARRAGVHTIIVPAPNRADVEEIPKDIRTGIRFLYAAAFDDVRRAAFAPKVRARKKRGARRG